MKGDTAAAEEYQHNLDYFFPPLQEFRSKFYLQEQKAFSPYTPCPFNSVGVCAIK